MHPPDPAGRIDRLLACLQTALGHELVNHSVAVRGLLRVLEVEAAPKLEADDLDLLRRAGGAAARAHTLIEELARLVRATRQPPPVGEADLAEAVPEVVAQVKQLAPGAAIEYHVVSASPSLKLSPLALRQTLTALVLALARLAGSARPLRVEFGAERRDGLLRLWVADDGPGWPQERLDRAFEPFAAVPAGEADAGLGLFPVRHLVEGCGGNVAVAAEAGRGTTFTITWKDQG